MYEYGKSKLKRFLKDREITKLHKDTIKRIRNRLSANPDEKLNIVFLVEEDSKWNAQSLYDELKNEPRINVNIAVKKTQFSELLREKQLYYFKKNYDFFRKIDENAIKMYNENAHRTIPVEELNADIIFYQQPWGMNDYPKRMMGRCLSAYMHYGFMLTDNNDIHYNLSSFHYYLWKYFTQTEGHKKLHLAHDSFASNKIIVSGYTKLDAYFENNFIDDKNIWKISKEENPNIKRVIYAPHWSFSKNNAFRLGTFNQNYKYFLDLAKNNKNIQWIYKPHKSLEYKAISENLMSEQEYRNYVEEWDSLPNAKVYNSGNYFDIFKTSDALITDCGSFLGEYLPTRKPIIHLLRTDSVGYNTVGQTIIKDYYKAYNLKELEVLLKRVILDGDDYLYDERMKALKFLIPNKEKSSSFIKNYIKQVVGLE